MTVIGDAAIVTSIILDIIKIYQAAGVKVDLDSLEEKISDLNAQWNKAKDGLKK